MQSSFFFRMRVSRTPSSEAIRRIISESGQRASSNSITSRRAVSTASEAVCTVPAAATVKFLSSELGAFPYSHLEITQLPALLSQAWPGLIYLSSTAFLTEEERRALKIHNPFTEMLLDELMLAHETAHQWWGDAVDWESYRDEWIVESLANYSALLMLERGHPEKMSLALDHYPAESQAMPGRSRWARG